MQTSNEGFKSMQQSGSLSTQKLELIKERTNIGENLLRFNVKPPCTRIMCHSVWSSINTASPCFSNPASQKHALYKKPHSKHKQSHVKSEAMTPTEVHTSGNETQLRQSTAHRARCCSVSSFKGQWKLL